MADYDINLKGNLVTTALEGAKSIDTLTAALVAEEKALKSSQTALARLQASGRSDLALAAKVKDGAVRIGNLKNRIAEARAAGEKPTKLGLIDAIEKSGGPIGGFIRNIKAASSALKDSPWVATAAGVGLVTVATAKLGVTLLGLAKDAAFAGFSLANEARKASLLNEAVDIAAGGHHQLSGIIEDTRRRSDVARDTLAGYARSIRMLGFDSRLTQLTLRAMGTAESALGSDASAGVRSIAEQSRQFRRLTLGARDAYGEYQSLRRIGLSKADLFGELAKQSGRSVADIQRSVAAGRVSTKAGVAAIEAALSRKFGGVARAQAMGISSQFRRMREDFEQLFTGADIEPLLKGLKSITSIFSENTSSGQSFKKVIGGLFTDLGKAAEEFAPLIKEAILGLAAEAAKPGGLATTIRGWINDAKAMAKSLDDVVTAIKAIGAAASAIAHPIDTFVNAVKFEGDKGAKAEVIEPLVSSAGSTKAGEEVAAGVAAGVKAGTPAAVDAVREMARKMEAGFKAEAEIRSPSARFDRQSQYIPQGAARGVKKTTPEAVKAVATMADRMGQAYAPSASRGGVGAPMSISFTAQFIGMNDDAELERKVKGWLVSSIKTAVDMGPQPRAA